MLRLPSPEQYSKNLGDHRYRGRRFLVQLWYSVPEIDLDCYWLVIVEAAASCPMIEYSHYTRLLHLACEALVSALLGRRTQNANI